MRENPGRSSAIPDQAAAPESPAEGLSAARNAHRAAGGGPDGARAADTILRDALRRWPGDPELRHGLAQVLVEQGRGPEAVREVQRATESAPGEARYWRTLGIIRRTMEDHDQAESAFRRACELAPRDVSFMDDHAASLRSLGKPAAAVAVLERACATDPQPVLRIRLAQALAEIGRGELALAPLKRAVAETNAGTPDGVEARTAYASQLVCLADRDDDAPAEPKELRAAHEAWAHGAKTLAKHNRLAQGLEFLPSRPRRRASDRLRVGYVSWDFREHSVAYFLEPLIEAHDRDRVEVVCYATGPTQGAMSQRFKDLADEWRETPLPKDRIGRDPKPYRAMLEAVRKDQIDVLIETGGHTVGSAIAGLAGGRAAPVQLSYLGYAATTGLDSIDARLVDRVTDTPGAEAWHTESLIRLDRCFLCYRPPARAPEVTPIDRPNRPITFGSFNRPAKLSDRTVSLWARAIAPIQGATLLLKSRSFAEEAVQRSVRTRFELAGLDGERVTFADRAASTEAHLGTYADVDIALDTLPYNGTTTTCEALWMGVPVLTRMGGVHAARVSGSILRAVGLDDMVCESDAAFIERSATLASDVDRRAELRRTMRDRMRASLLMDQRSLAQAVETAIDGLATSARTAA